MHRNGKRFPVNESGKPLTRFKRNGSDLRAMPGFGRSTCCQGKSWNRTAAARRGWSAVTAADVTRGWAGDRSVAAMHVFSSYSGYAKATGERKYTQGGMFVGRIGSPSYGESAIAAASKTIRRRSYQAGGH